MRLVDLGRRVRLGLVMVMLAGCGMVAPPPATQRPAPDPVPMPVAPVAAQNPGRMPPELAVQTFVDVVRRVEPVAEAFCRESAPQRNCDFLIRVDDRPGQPINAFQSRDDTGRPIITFTAALILDARSADELAFVLGHEAAHHIAGHLDRQRDTALAGALIAGALAAAVGGNDPRAIRTAQEMGAAVGARTYSKDFELEADAGGTIIAWRAGFDPERGAGFFARLPDPGNRFLGTHPPNEARIFTVRRTLDRLRAR